MMYSRALLLLAALSVGATVRLSAQEKYPVSFEVTVGAGVGEHADGAAAVDAFFATRAQAARRGALLVGLSGAIIGDIATEPRNPAFASLGVLAGREVGRGLGGSVRALVGPAYVNGDGTSVLGVQSRIDVATPAPFRIALVASLRGTLLPRFREQMVTFGAVGLGLRLQM